jgi:uncharacterized membrane protein HdeD (DUF308 family)
MENKIKHYSISLLINGIIALLFGGLAIFLPQATIKTITVYFGILLLVGGAGSFLASVKNMKGDKPYISTLIISVVAIVIGLIFIFNPRLSLELFGIVIGIWAVVIGAVQLFIALQLLEPGKYKRLMTINSIITLLFGLILFVSPFGSIVILTRIIGIMAVIFGGIMLFFSISIRSAK